MTAAASPPGNARKAEAKLVSHQVTAAKRWVTILAFERCLKRGV